MKDLNQEIIRFNYDQNFTNEDFFVSKSNHHIFSLLNEWPKWSKNFFTHTNSKLS